MSFAARSTVREFFGGVLPLISDTSGTHAQITLSNDEGVLTRGSGPARALCSTAMPANDQKLFTRLNSAENFWSSTPPYSASAVWGHDYEVRFDLTAGSYNTTDWFITTLGAWVSMRTSLVLGIRSGHTGDGTFTMQIRMANSTKVLTSASYRLKL